MWCDNLIFCNDLFGETVEAIFINDLKAKQKQILMWLASALQLLLLILYLIVSINSDSRVLELI